MNLTDSRRSPGLADDRRDRPTVRSGGRVPDHVPALQRRSRTSAARVLPQARPQEAIGCLGIALRQAHEDGVAVGDQDLSILQHGDLAERIQPQELGRAASLRRSGDESKRNLEHPQQQHDAMGVAGVLGAVDDDLGVAHDWGVWRPGRITSGYAPSLTLPGSNVRRDASASRQNCGVRRMSGTICGVPMPVARS